MTIERQVSDFECMPKKKIIKQCTLYKESDREKDYKWQMRESIYKESDFFFCFVA